MRRELAPASADGEQQISAAGSRGDQISQIEGGIRKSPGFFTIAKIANALSLSLDDLARVSGISESAGANQTAPPFAVQEVQRMKVEALRLSERADVVLAAFEPQKAKISQK
jgi:transcriptional regulator with XRE-family HTH domain